MASMEAVQEGIMCMELESQRMGEERIGAEAIFEEILANNFPQFLKDDKSHIHGALKGIIRTKIITTTPSVSQSNY